MPIPIYPMYNSVRDVKIKCYPNLSEISVTETKASIKLQGLLDHTVQRLILMISTTKNILFDKLTLFTK
jgi:hypothetical protein